MRKLHADKVTGDRKLDLINDYLLLLRKTVKYCTVKFTFSF